MASPAHVREFLVSAPEPFVGPLPPPTVLAEYEHLVPGTAERLLEMARRRQDHRRRLEHDLLADARREQRVGQIFALLLVLCAIGAAVYLSTHGSQIAGAIIGSMGLSAQVIAFVSGSRRETRETLAAQIDGLCLHDVK